MWLVPPSSRVQRVHNCNTSRAFFMIFKRVYFQNLVNVACLQMTSKIWSSHAFTIWSKTAFQKVYKKRKKAWTRDSNWAALLTSSFTVPHLPLLLLGFLLHLGLPTSTICNVSHQTVLIFFPNTYIVLLRGRKEEKMIF